MRYPSGFKHHIETLRFILVRLKSYETAVKYKTVSTLDSNSLFNSNKMQEQGNHAQFTSRKQASQIQHGIKVY